MRLDLLLLDDFFIFVSSGLLVCQSQLVQRWSEDCGLKTKRCIFNVPHSLIRSDVSAATTLSL